MFGMYSVMGVPANACWVCEVVRTVHPLCRFFMKQDMEDNEQVQSTEKQANRHPSDKTLLLFKRGFCLQGDIYL